MSTTTPGVRERLQAGLVTAMKAKNMVATQAIRSALAAVANAEAVGTTAATAAPSGSVHVAGAAVGVGAAEAPRRDLTERDVLDVVDAEITGRRAHADEYDDLGRPDAAEQLRAEAAVLESFLTA